MMEKMTNDDHDENNVFTHTNSKIFMKLILS